MTEKVLQVRKGVYTISDEWSGYSYFGGGIYASYYGEMRIDMKNPFYLKKLKVVLDKFNKVKEVL